VSKPGYLIAIEGIDGSGKSTLAQEIKKSLKNQSREILLTQEPGGTELGSKLRVLLHEEKKHVCDQAEYLLFATDRSQHFEQVIIPALEQNKIIISDRLSDSSLAYQGYGRGLDIPMIKQINQWAMRNIEPDLVFYIKLDFKTALERIMLRAQKLTSFETEQELFWQRVIKGFETIFKNRKNVVTLDGTETPEELAKQATQEILKRT